MKPFKIGAIVDSFKLPLYEAIQKASEIGAQGIQMYAVYGETGPQAMTAKKRKELLDVVKSNDLVFSALCGELGGHGLSISKDNPQRVDMLKRVVDMAKDLECDIVTTHIGVIPQDQNHDRYKILQDACGQLGEYAQAMGSTFAIETGPEKTHVLRTFLDSLKCGKGMSVNYDPANLVMVTDEDPVAGVENVKDYITHTHAKDGVLLSKTDPQIVYDFFAEGGIEGLNVLDYFQETPLGQGDVDFAKYLLALKQSGFSGFLTIERECGDNPADDIKMAVAFLNEIMDKI
jgi:L-ribulose-5-phosphate 3-epimerase